MTRLQGLYVLDPRAFELTYGPDEQRDIAELVDITAPPQTSGAVIENPSLLARADVIFSGWGGPVLSEELLKAAPNLKAVFYGAGSISPIATDAAWDRGVIITTAHAANSVPVAEYTLATIVFSLKHGWRLANQTRESRRFPNRDDAPGCYHAIVGLVSLGMIGRTLLKYLEPFDLHLLAYDPFVSAREAAELGVDRVSLEELFRRCDVVSLHTPWLPETDGLITGELIASMKQGATLINTARGGIIREPELLEVLARRPDLQAVLDVATKEPPEPDSPLYTLPNVVLTPHIAGSVGQECQRMGRYMVEELRRYVAGQPLEWVVTREQAAWTCHRPALLWRSAAKQGRSAIRV